MPRFDPDLPAASHLRDDLPALAGCAVGSLWKTIHGANLAKRMKVRELKIAFATILLLAAAKMLRTVLA